MTDRDTITRTRARAPGAEDHPSSMAVHYRVRTPDSEREICSDYEMHEGRMQTRYRTAYAGSRLKPQTIREGTPAFQPYWGKPAVRNDREDRGNVGIIRSPIRASILPDFH